MPWDCTVSYRGGTSETCGHGRWKAHAELAWLQRFSGIGFVFSGAGRYQPVFDVNQRPEGGLNWAF